MGVAVLVIVAAFFLLIIIGKLKGPPSPGSLSDEGLLGRIQSEEAWIRKYKDLPYENQQLQHLKKMYEEKKLFILQMQLEFANRHSEQDKDKSLLPALQRTIELVRQGMSEEDARAQAIKEFQSERGRT